MGVGCGCGFWLMSWVKKKSSKKKIKIKKLTSKSCKIYEMNASPIPLPRGQQSI